MAGEECRKERLKEQDDVMIWKDIEQEYKVENTI